MESASWSLQGKSTVVMGSNLQELLRFLSGDAKIPLAVAMGYAKGLSSAKLMRYIPSKAKLIEAPSLSQSSRKTDWMKL
jgi:hypothetical protein